MEKLDNHAYIVNNDLYLKNRELNRPADNKKSENINKKKRSFFGEILESELEKNENNIQKDINEIQNMLRDIGLQGENLKKSRNIEDLDIYKKLVKKYITTIVNISEDTEKKSVYNRIKKEKITKVHLNIIDKELLELTKIFMSEQYEVLKIANKIDKIEGLIISIFS